jgi:tRNA dimethylallyltransferase
MLASHLADKLTTADTKYDIINADAMQLYCEIPILTASPSDIDKRSHNHRLYNFLSVFENYSVAKYLEQLEICLDDVYANGRRAIIVGGTGLYINSFLNGIHDIPSVSDEILRSTRELALRLGSEKMYELFYAADPESASRIDTQRVIRAYCVKLSTGRSIIEFYNCSKKPLVSKYVKETAEADNAIGVSIVVLYTKPERGLLYSICNERFINIIHSGAIDEVNEVLAHNHKQDHNIGTTASKAIGFNEIKEYLIGKISFDEMILQSQINTRHLAKRQITWFSNQLKNDSKTYQKITLEYTKIHDLLSF